MFTLRPIAQFTALYFYYCSIICVVIEQPVHSCSSKTQWEVPLALPPLSFPPSPSITYWLSFLKMLFIFREMGRREKHQYERETLIDCVSYMP